MADGDCEEDWADDAERDIHARIHDPDTGNEIHISTVRDDDYERLVDCRAYDPFRKEYGEGVAIHLTDLHDFMELVSDAVWQRKQRGRIEHYSRIRRADGTEIHLSTMRDDGHERFVFLRQYQAASQEYGEELTIPVGLLSDVHDGVSEAWHANGAGNWEGKLGPYMDAEGPDE